MLLPLIAEPYGCERLNNLRLLSKHALVGQDEFKNRCGLLASVNVVLDVERADYIWGRETFDLTIHIVRIRIIIGDVETNPLVMARMSVDLPVPFLPHRP